MTITPEIERTLGSEGVIAFDPSCEEPVAWGRILNEHLGEDAFKNLKAANRLHYRREDGKWAVVTRSLTRDEAAVKYGPHRGDERGPRGGWRSVTFGTKKFTSPFLKPEEPAAP
jgi:hypothetical protein